jgi:hypothetical protein
MKTVSANGIAGKILVGVGLVLMVYFLWKENWMACLALAILPLSFFLGIRMLLNPYAMMLCLFVYNYFVMGLYRYLPIGQMGLGVDGLIVLVLLSLMVRTILRGDVDWSKAKNWGVMLLFVWLLYNLLEFFNPSAVTEAWVYGIRSAVYPIAGALLTSLVFYRYKDFKLILLLWSVFSILAVIKMQMQVWFGFDAAEMRFLIEGDRQRLVFVNGTIRYFSFFSDAGNFGSNMGCVMVVFSIAAIYTKKKFLKFYYALVGLLGMYAMFVSGTRGAIAVPFAGFLLFTILTKNFKALVISGLFLFGAYFFLAETTIGQGNTYIRRMRTAFDPNEASLMVRKQNQKTLALYLKDKPFGEGVGLGGVESAKFANRVTTSIPSDSGLVKVWCQTGIVGLVLYLTLYALIVGYGTFIVLFRIRDPELRGLLSAIICGMSGLLASTYGNSIFTQFPTVMLMAMAVGFIYMGKRYDQEIQLNNQQTVSI